MRHDEAILAKRTVRHLAHAHVAWNDLEMGLLRLGVRPTLFGSLAKGDFREGSDIDVTVDMQGRPSCVKGAVERLVAKVVQRWGVPIDLLYEDYLTEENLARLHGN